MNGLKIELSKFQLVELIKGALLYGASPVCVLRETEHPGHLNVRGFLRHYVPNKGLYPLRRFAAIFLRQKA